MQTFLPYPDFSKSARCLDRQRLGKQRVECLQILNAITVAGYGWKNHPIVKMWRGHEFALCEYGITICDEWVKRGYKDSCRARFERFMGNCSYQGKPEWLGNEKLHKSHQSNLLRKDKEHYSQFGWNVQDNLPYFWAI